MTAADLIAALQALPPETEIILADSMEADGLYEVYAKAAGVSMRHLDPFSLKTMDWDFTPTSQPFEHSVPVALIVSAVFERDDMVLASGHPHHGVARYSIAARKPA